ncbi:MAG: TIGR00303 family protein [Leptolyngbyaceae cyanobacterium MO_188.B28]|nr:TIGR00303 family protein [Leptolyngbyaceae cyanobacterium MO_188.B28]
MIQVYTEVDQGHAWLTRHRGKRPIFACILGFTETGLIPGISAAGAEPEDRKYTAIADAEFLYRGPQPASINCLPPLQAGVSPALISRAVITGQEIPLYLFNAGLLIPPSAPTIDLGGSAAACLSQGKALEPSTVIHLLRQGLAWGEKLAAQCPDSYLILGECVVGGTTTALAILIGLGFKAADKVNSSHPTCNHRQKWQVVQKGLQQWRSQQGSQDASLIDPLDLLTAVGDPMQVVVAGMAIAASRSVGVLLAGGTQMLAIYALMRAIAKKKNLPWRPEQIVIGTTHWVVADPSGDTIGLAKLIGDAPLMATQLNFAASRYAQLRAYEKGYVKEGVGAGGCAIAAHLYQNWGQDRLLDAIEILLRDSTQVDSQTP